jgi:hypothetical protein
LVHALSRGRLAVGKKKWVIFGYSNKYNLNTNDTPYACVIKEEFAVRIIVER